MGHVDGRLNFDTKIDTKGFSKGLNSLSGQMQALMGLAGKLASALAAAFSVKEIIEAAAEVKAAQSQFEQTFGELQSQAQKMIDGVAANANILDTRLKGVATSIYAFAKTSGMDSSQSLQLMNDALEVTADSAAYYDRSLEATAETLQSFLKGNYANDAALGISCTETTRNTAANKLYGKSFQELSEAQKQLTLLQMVKDANKLSGAMGQAAREADGWENVTGNLKEAWKQLLAVIGQPLLALAIPIVKRITSALQELTAAAQNTVKALSAVFGIDLESAEDAESLAESADTAAENYEAMVDSAQKAEDANEGSLMSFDKINKISGEDSGSEESGAAAAVLTADTQQAEGKFTAFFDSIREQLAGLKKYIENNFGSAFKGLWSGLTGETETLKATLGGVFNDLSTLAQPLQDYFSTDFLTLLQTSYQTAGNILTGLFNSFNRVFSDIWNLAAFPMLQSFITLGLPMLTQFATQSVLTLGTLFDSVKEIFDKLWQEAAVPVLGGISQLWTDLMQTMSDLWNEWGAPIFNGLREAIDNTKDTLLNAWDTIFKPIFDSAMENLDKIWSDHLQPLLSEFLDFFGELITGGEEIYNRFILPLVNAFIDQFGPVIVRVMKVVTNTLGEVVGNLIDALRGVIKTLRGVVQFLTGVFTGDWKKAWQGIKTIFKGVWDAFYNIVKAPINLIIGAINALVNGVESAINLIVDSINSLSFDVPDWVPGIGGTTFGFNLGRVELPEIPKLAQGTVVPANYGEFLAILGDNKRETEVVSPMSTIEQAVMSAALKLGLTGQNGQKQPIVVQVVLNKHVVGQAAIDDINDRTRLNGYSPLKT